MNLQDQVNEVLDSEDVTRESDQMAIDRLSRLSAIEYDRVRSQEAEKLEINLSTLDREVKNRRKQTENDNSPFADIEPWHESIKPDQLLDEVSGTIQRFIVLDKYQADIAALWLAVCWFVEVIHCAVIALINAPERSCGKSQLLSVMSRLAPRATQLSGISPSVLFRMIEKFQPTLFVDEIETVLKDNEELRGLLNAGHTRDSAYVWRSVAAGDDFEPKRFSVWGMKAVAGINAIKLADTVTSRSIVFELKRKRSNEKLERLRNAEPELFENLKAKFARFAQDYSEQVKKAQPTLPEALGDREQDNIEPLLQVACVAGGHWPETAEKAALKIFNVSRGEQSLSGQLLTDIQEIFETQSRDNKIFKKDLMNALVSDDEKPWQTYNRGKPLTPKQLSDRLKPYDILAKTVRIGYETKKGYELAQFQDTFDRYLTTPLNFASQGNNSLKPNTDNDLRVTGCVTEETPKSNSVTNVTENIKCDACDVTQTQKVTLKPAPALGCDVVTKKTPLRGSNNSDTGKNYVRI